MDGGAEFFYAISKANKSSRLGLKWSGKQTTKAYSPRSIKASDNIRQRLPPKSDPLDDVSLQALFKYFARLYFDASRTEAFERNWKSCLMNKYSRSWLATTAKPHDTEAKVLSSGNWYGDSCRRQSAEQWHDFQVAFKFIQLITFWSCLTAKRLPSPGSHFSSSECLLFCWHVDFFPEWRRQISFHSASTMTCRTNASLSSKNTPFTGHRVSSRA